MGLKIAALLLLVAGWILMLAALVMLPLPASRTAFLWAGAAVQVLGFVLLAHAHIPKRKKRDA